MSNTQRITKLSRKEKAAAVSGGALDLHIPEPELRRCLQYGRIAFDVDAVLNALAHHVAWWRQTHQAPHLKPSKVRERAVQTVDAIDDLIARLDHMHPDLLCLVDESLYRVRGEFCMDLQARITPDLHLIGASLRRAICTMESAPVRTGPKGDWSALKDAVADLLRANSDPQISMGEAKALAADLIDLCGLQKARNT